MYNDLVRQLIYFIISLQDLVRNKCEGLQNNQRLWELDFADVQ